MNSGTVSVYISALAEYALELWSNLSHFHCAFSRLSFSPVLGKMAVSVAKDHFPVVVFVLIATTTLFFLANAQSSGKCL